MAVMTEGVAAVGTTPGLDMTSEEAMIRVVMAVAPVVTVEEGTAVAEADMEETEAGMVAAATLVVDTQVEDTQVEGMVEVAAAVVEGDIRQIERAITDYNERLSTVE